MIYDPIGLTMVPPGSKVAWKQEMRGFNPVRVSESETSNPLRACLVKSQSSKIMTQLMTVSNNSTISCPFWICRFFPFCVSLLKDCFLAFAKKRSWWCWIFLTCFFALNFWFPQIWPIFCCWISNFHYFKYIMLSWFVQLAEKSVDLMGVSLVVFPAKFLIFYLCLYF